MASVGVANGQFAERRRGVDGQLGSGRQRLTVVCPASRRRRNSSDDCFDDELLPAPERLR